MVITPKPSRSNELVSMLSLLEFITPLDATLLMERNLICFHSQLLKGTPPGGGGAHNWQHVREQQEASYGRKADTRASADLMPALPAVSCCRAANRNADA